MLLITNLTIRLLAWHVHKDARIVTLQQTAKAANPDSFSRMDFVYNVRSEPIYKIKNVLAAQLDVRPAQIKGFALNV